MWIVKKKQYGSQLILNNEPYLYNNFTFRWMFFFLQLEKLKQRLLTYKVYIQFRPVKRACL